MNKDLKKFYSFENYKPNKNAKPIMYNGTQYLSKAQCMALEGITRKELDEYLKNQDNDIVGKAPEQDIIDEILGDAKIKAPDKLNDFNVGVIEGIGDDIPF